MVPPVTDSLLNDASEVLRRVFGFDSFRGQQLEIIEHVAAGGDALVLMPTGAGKSLCYQIPALLRQGPGVVVSPLIALMQAAQLPDRTAAYDSADVLVFNNVDTSALTTAQRNAIGTHAGGYALYRALAIAASALPSNHRPNLTDTAPADLLGPHPQGLGDTKIVSLDPWGHLVGEAFKEELARGLDIRPTIAVTRAASAAPRK